MGAATKAWRYSAAAVFVLSDACLHRMASAWLTCDRIASGDAKCMHWGFGAAETDSSCAQSRHVRHQALEEAPAVALKHRMEFAEQGMRLGLVWCPGRRRWTRAA